MTVDEAAGLILGEIAEQIGRPLSWWHSQCFVVAQLILGRFQLTDTKPWAIGNADPESAQDKHAMILAPDGRVLDPLYWEAKYSIDPARSADKHPFLGTHMAWGRGRGFDASIGTEMDPWAARQAGGRTVRRLFEGHSGTSR